ncbi:MAG: ABC transporter permease [Saprospiraceae bacterium]
MLKYALTKLLIFFPVVFLIAIAVFFVSEIAPGDKIDAYMDIFGSNANENPALKKADYIMTAKKLKLDKPEFYFSIRPYKIPDNYNSIILPENKKIVDSLIASNIDKTEIEKLLKFNIESEKYDLKNIITQYKFNKKSGFLSNLPVFRFNGTDNRFHNWFKNIIKMDFGISYVDGRNVSSKLSEALPYTIIYVLMAYLFSLLISLPIALYSQLKENSISSRIINISLTLFYAMPLFWLATMAVIFLTSDEVFTITNIFPAIGIGNIFTNMTLTEKIKTAIPHLLLPALILAIHSGAYLSILISRSLKKEMGNPYFKGIITKGITKKSAIVKHAFPNSLIPLITAIVVSLPGSIAGSVVIEVIFNIPGMGRLLYNSILKMDWNVVFAIVMIVGVMTYIFYIIGDLIYYRLNARMKLN